MNKLYLGKWNTLIFMLAISLHSCAPFRDLPKPINKSHEMTGIYSDDCTDTDIQYMNKLWNLLEPKYKKSAEGQFVFLKIENDKQLKAYLISENDTIREKQIKGKFKDDQCFYTRRIFYIVPIFPLLWWYRNEHDRICLSCEHLIFENAYNQGGMAIIIANGTKGNDIRKFKKLTNKGPK